jgi:hypothetical protein
MRILAILDQERLCHAFALKPGNISWFLPIGTGVSYNSFSNAAAQGGRVCLIELRRLTLLTVIQCCRPTSGYGDV